jgi:hypothetical protein
MFSDVTFILEGSKEVPAHKIMLARCPYFAAMFSMEMREKTMDKIKLENISYNIFMLVMKYLYSDECVINLEVR